MGDFTDLLGTTPEAEPEPLTTPATQPRQQPKSEFLRLLEGPSEQDQRLGSNLSSAASTTPDAHQKAVDVGKTIGAPADSVAANLKEAEHLAKLQRYREALHDAPKLQKLLAEDPDLAKISADDLKVLGNTERTLSFFGSMGRGVDIAQGMGYGFLEATGEATGVDSLTSFGRAGRIANQAEAQQYGDRSSLFDIRSFGQAGQYAKETVGEQIPLMAGPLAGGFGGAAAGFAVGGPVGATIGAIIGAFVPSLVLGVGETQGTIKEKDPDAVAPGYAFGAGALIAALDSALPGKVGSTLVRVLGREGTEEVLKRSARALAVDTVKGATLEGTTEAVQEVIGEVAASQATGQEVDARGLAEQMVEAFVVGFGMGGGVEGGTHVVGAIGSNRRKATEAAQNSAVVEALVKGTADSKLRDRNPDAFAAVMAAQTQGTPVEQFFIPAERIAELYQTGAPVVDGVDPLDQIEGLRDQLTEALAVGGDVEISAADYLTHIAPTELHGKLKNDLRASRDGWSVNQAKEFAENPEREAEVAALVERQAAAVEAAAPGQAVFDQAYADLMDTGRYTSAQAAEKATLTRERFVSRSQRVFGGTVTPEALYQESRLQILGPTEAGDVAPAGALSQDEGFTVDAFHGTTADITEFDPAKIGTGTDRGHFGKGFYFAKSAELGSDYAGSEAGSNVLPVKLRLQNPYTIPNRAAYGDRAKEVRAADSARLGIEIDPNINEDPEALTAALQAAGYDGVIVQRSDGGAEYVVFDAAQVRSRFAAFDPSRAGESGLLLQRAAKPLGTDPKEVAHTVIDILYGDTPAVKANTREVGDIARDLMARGQKALRALGVKGGVIEGPDPKTDEIISRAIAAELKAALEKSSRNASDWYTRKVEEAMAIAATMHPEIATDPIAQMGFTAALAITSQGETVPSNVRLADPIYRHFRETGRFPTEVKAKNGPAMGINFAKLNKLLDERGPEGTRAFLHGQFTVGDLKKAGYPIGGENVTTVVYGSAILGPKIGGGFFQNLNRNYSPVTMDLWFMRAWGRITGTLVGNTNPESLQKQRDRLTAALEAAGRKVPKTDATLEKQAEEIRTAHESDFKKNRAAYDSGEKSKAELTYAAERYLIGLNGINEQPGSGSERVWMRERVGRAQELLAQEGIKLTAADAQAVWWYPEKDLYAKLGGRDSEAINVDYAGALTELARSKGVSDDTITRAVGALDQRSGPTGRADDGRADDGGGQGDQGSGAGTVLFQTAAGRAGADIPVGGPRPNARQGLYTRTGGGRSRELLLGDLPVAARWESSRGGPVMFELEPGAAAAQAFREAIVASKQNNPHGAAVYVYPDEDYAVMRLFLTEDGQAGIALKGVDTVSVFNAKGSPHKKAGVHMVLLAVQLGGRTLDAFDTVLPRIYADAGFEVAARLPWDESQAPDGWDKSVFGEYQDGQPDVVFMAYTGRVGAYVEGEGPYATDYDDALRLQREASDAYELSQDPGRDVETLFPASQDGAVSIDALAGEGNDQAIVLQALMDGPGLGVQKLADILESVAGLSEAERLGSVPALAPVLAHMRRVILDNPKVLDAVVGSVPVDVVNNLFGSESAAKVALHDEAMLKDSPAFNAELPVSGGLGDTANAVGLLVRQSAFSAAEMLRGQLGAGREAAEGGGALGARQGDGLGQGVLGSYQRVRDPYGNFHNIIRLTQNSNLSTALHEFGHFYLFQLIDDAYDPRATPEARVALKADLKVILDHVGITIDLATATADQVHAAMTREAHELWARSFEVYLREGKAPSSALRDAFASFASWLVRIYKSLKTLPDYTKRLTPEVRGVMDRLLATDEAIADAQNSASFRVPAALRTVMTTAEQRSLERLTEEATHEARAELQKRVMAELARERMEWWREERARVRGEVETEVRNRPAYRAYNLLRHGETPDGSPTLDADGNPSTTRLDRAGLAQAYGKDVLKQLPKGVSAQNGVSHEVFAGVVGFGSGDELVDALKTLAPMRATIDAETDARMKAKHGDMLTDGRLQADAAEIVLNQKQVELAALQARVLERLAAGVKAKADKKAASGKREAVKQVRRLQTGLDAKAIAAAAKKAIAGKRIEDAVPAKYRAQADRLGREVEVAIAKGDYELAARLKEQQVVNMALAREAQEVQAAVGKALKRFGRLRKPDSKLAKGTDIEFIGAARAMLSHFGLSSPQVGFDQQVWFEKLEEQSPAGAAQLRSMIDAATTGAGQVAARGRTRTRAKPGGAPTAMGDVWRQMTVDEFRSLTDTVDAILSNGRDARSVQLGEERVAIKEASDELLAQASGRDTGKRIGQTQAVTDAEKRTRSFWGVAAFLERVESWARRMDDGKVGPYTRRIVQPVLAVVYEYRAAKTGRVKQMVDILEPRKADLLGKPIRSDELNYTFGNKGELLHAILHSGNDGNFRKLLLGGRGKNHAWGEIDKKTGALDTSKWDRMINRMVRDGTLTKADYDTAQQIWDLLEELKGPAQVAHRRMFGFYFKEVEVTGIQTPFGKFRGGYAPAISDRRLNPEAGAKVDANAMGDLQNAGILPTVAKGFTRSRVEYNQPLELNISKLVGHMDTVLKFTYLGPTIRDVTRLVTNREFRSEMFGIDAHAIDEVLVPWLQRVSRQTSEIPFTSEGARTFGKFFKALQKHTGIAAMAGNILNAAQQITGLSVAMAEVRPTRVLRGLVSSVGAPRQSAQMIMGKSAFMRDRMDNSTHELMTTLDDLLTDKGRYRKLQDKAGKHAYFAQIFAQNLVDRAVWLGAYEQGVAKGLTEEDAVLGADAVVRQTQGSFAPEDVSRVEVQNAFARPFVQFYSYFNSQFNFLRTKFDSTVQELGWVGGSPRLFYIYLMGAMVPAVLADAMMQAATGQLGDDDDDGLIDDIGELFAMSQLRYFAAMVPGVGTAVNFGIHLANDKPYDDRLSVAPVVSQAERIGGTVVKLWNGKESTTGRAIADALMLISMATGLPLAQVGKPLGYFTDVGTGEQEGATVGDWIRGTLTGREAPKQ